MAVFTTRTACETQPLLTEAVVIWEKRGLGSVVCLSFLSVVFWSKAAWTHNRLWLLTGNVSLTLRLSVTGVKQCCVLVSTLTVTAGRRFLISWLRHLCFGHIPPSLCVPASTLVGEVVQGAWTNRSKVDRLAGQTHESPEHRIARGMRKGKFRWEGGDLTFSSLVVSRKSWKKSVESFDLAFDYLFLARTERRMILMPASWLMLPEKREDTENREDYRKDEFTAGCLERPLIVVVLHW